MITGQGSTLATPSKLPLSEAAANLENAQARQQSTIGRISDLLDAVEGQGLRKGEDGSTTGGRSADPSVMERFTLAYNESERIYSSLTSLEDRLQFIFGLNLNIAGSKG